MSDQSVLKEFLIALGFKVNEAGLKRFTGTVDKVSKTVMATGKAAAVMAMAVEVAVTKVAKQFEDLYFASQRLHSTVENIQATGFAMSQMGGDARGARAAMEGISSMLRSNPGGEGWIRSLGIETRDAKGELRDTADMMAELGDAFRNMPYYMAKPRAAMLGIDESTLMAMIRGTGEFSARYKEIAKRVGIDQQKSAESAHEFMVQLRDVQTLILLTAEKMLLRLAPAVQKVIKWFDKLDESTGGLSTQLALLLSFLIPLTIIFGPIVAGIVALSAGIFTLYQDYQNWKNGSSSFIDWGKWSVEINRAIESIQSLGGALGILSSNSKDAGKSLLDNLGPNMSSIVMGSLSGITGLLDLMANSIKIVAALLNGDWAAAWSATKKTSHDFVSDMRHTLGQYGEDAKPGGAAKPPGAAAKPPGVAAGGVGGKIQEFFKSKGYSQAQALGIASGIWAESKFNPNALGPNVAKRGKPESRAFGIGQWLGSRRAALFKRYGNHPSLDQQLEFMAWELMGGGDEPGGKHVRGQTSARGTLQAYITKFMRPGEGHDTMADLARGSQYLSSQSGQPVLATTAPANHVAINQKTDIHVSGAADPHTTGRIVMASQERVNGDLVRNTRGALR